MIDTGLRKLKDIVLRPVAAFLNRFLSPLAVTLIAFAIGLGAVYALWRGMYWIALGLWFASRVLDGLDGTMARMANRQSDLGGYFDLMCDVILYALFPIAAAMAHYGAARAGTVLVPDTEVGIFIALSLLLASYYINLACWAVLAAILEKRPPSRPRGHSEHSGHVQAAPTLTTIQMPRGIIEGFETVVIYSFFCIFPQFLWYIFIGTAILTTVSALMRMAWAIRHRGLL